MSCLILFVSQATFCKTYDKKIADTMYCLLAPCTLNQDTGYQGYAPKNLKVIQPVNKKGKGTY